jgi:hypothetical protein
MPRGLHKTCGDGLPTKRVMVSFTYMRSEADCVWQIPFEQATLRDRRFIDSKAVHRVMLILQDLEASTQSAIIRTGVNELMTRFDLYTRRPARQQAGHAPCRASAFRLSC